MSITPPAPVLQGDRGTELRADGADLLLLRREDELRIPLAAIARVRAERRHVMVELTAPAGVEPVVYRIEDVSAAAATLFADAVNTALPERADGTETIDGSTLVVTRSLRSAADIDEDEEDEDRTVFATQTWVRHILCGVAAVLAVVVGVADQSWSRGIATLLLGQATAVVAHPALVGIAATWVSWYLPRYGVTVDARHVYRNGSTKLAYTDTDGVTHHLHGSSTQTPVRVSYPSGKPQKAVLCVPWKMLRSDLTMFLVIAGIAALLGYGVYELAVPAFGS